MIGDSGCCGFHINRSKATFLGLLTLSLPIVFLSAFLNAILYMIGRIYRPIETLRKLIVAVQDANLRLISSIDFNSRLRCAITGKIFSYSPKAAGLLYRYFNLLILIIFWALIIGFIYL
ncbi:hypothetical protein ACFL1I_00390, partial [Candidatus Omnitrophota bacterium]